MTEQSSDVYKHVYQSLNEIKKKLTEMSFMDLSQIHIDQEWSWMPYVKDHIDFLLEQTNGVLESLKDSPPPSIMNIENIDQ